MEKKILRSQISWFFRTNYQSNFERLSLDIKEKISEQAIFSSIIPIPQDAPPEFPRLTLGYKDFNINISKNRADLHINIDKYDAALIDYISDVLTTQAKLEIGRVALVKVYFIDGDMSILMKKLAVKYHELKLREMAIRINKKSNIESRECNNIESVELGSIQDLKAGTSKEGFIVTRDINTLAENLTRDIYNSITIKTLINRFEEESTNFTLV